MLSLFSNPNSHACTHNFDPLTTLVYRYSVHVAPILVITILDPLSTHNFDPHKDDDGEEQEEDGAVQSDVVVTYRSKCDVSEQTSLRNNVCLHGECVKLMASIPLNRGRFQDCITTHACTHTHTHAHTHTHTHTHTPLGSQ